MNDHPTLDPRERLDLLISRIADGEAGETDWSAFNALAENNPAAWRHLAQAQKDHGAMSLAVGVALHAADRVDLPTPEAAALWTRRAQQPTHIRTLTRFGAWSGWAAAAVVALAWFGGFGGGSRGFQPDPNIRTAGLSVNSPDDAIKAYLDLGGKEQRVVGELPNRVLVDSQPTVLESGQRGVTVLYVRQFVERAVVTDLARLGLDESGRPVPVPMTAPSATPVRYAPQ